ERIAAKYGYSANRARVEIERFQESDVELIPLLLDRLDVEIQRGRITNPAGLLRSWLQTFDLWRPQLEAARARSDREKSGEGNTSPEPRDPYLEYLDEIDLKARDLRGRLEPTELRS